MVDVVRTGRRRRQLREAVLAPGGSHTFPERTENMGTWTAVRKIRHLRANIAGEQFEKHLEEDCEGVHANLHYTVYKEKTFNVKEKLLVV